MELSDFNKDLRRFLLTHWTEKEITRHLSNPEYFFEQLVLPRVDYLKANGEDPPSIRLQRKPSGELLILLRS